MAVLDTTKLFFALNELTCFGQGIKNFRNIVSRDKMKIETIYFSELNQYLDDLHSQLTSLGLPLSAASTADIRTALSEAEVIPEKDSYCFSQGLMHRIQGAIEDTTCRLRDELASRIVIVLPAAKSQFYDPPTPILGKEVAQKLPNCVEDIAEAGKCFALGRNTACVFHLMRTMEVAVQKFGNKLGVQLVHEMVWQKILNNINAVIKTLPQNDQQTKYYAALSAHLYNVKLAWRNEVMHPKASYSECETNAILGAVRNFLDELIKVF